MNTSDYFYQFKAGNKGNWMFWLAELLPLFLWIYILFANDFQIPKISKSQKQISKFILCIPFLGVFFNIFLSWRLKGPTPPREWDFCLNTDISERNLQKGVVGSFDYTCYYNHVADQQSRNQAYANRLFYIFIIKFI